MPALSLCRAGKGSTDQGACAAPTYIKEPLNYWHSLSNDQREGLMTHMPPEDRANVVRWYSTAKP